MKWLLFLGLVLPVMGFQNESLQPHRTRVGILISSYGQQDPNLSYDLEELAQAYLVFRQNGMEVDLISPKGGAVPVKTNKDDLAYIKRFKEETPALKQLSETLPAKNIDPSHYQAVFIVGGSGAMMDLPTDPSSLQFLTAMIEADRPIAAVCHGPAALTNIKTKDGSYFLTGKQVCSFTNREERAFGAENLEKFPFLLETKLREHGAVFVSNAPMLPFVAVDGNLITAQNPGSVAGAAEALILKLGLPLKPRQLFRDEATLALIAQARAMGPSSIDLALARDPERYDLQYLGLYAFYSYSLAASEMDKKIELTLMETIADHFVHPMLLEALVRALNEQGLKARAQKVLNRLEKEFPEHQGLPKLRQQVANP